MKHMWVECCNNCANFNKGKKDMVFHDFIDCVREYLIGQLSFINKKNSITLMKHKLPQPNVFNGTLWVVGFLQWITPSLQGLVLE
jgi:hypothetical protein